MSAALAVCAVIGGVVLMALIPVLALAVCLWETWWLLPLWEWSVVEMGGPSITFAQLVCLNVFVSSVLAHAQSLPKDEKPGAAWARCGVLVCRPVLAYYSVVFYRWWVA